MSVRDEAKVTAYDYSACVTRHHEPTCTGCLVNASQPGAQRVDSICAVRATGRRPMGAPYPWTDRLALGWTSLSGISKWSVGCGGPSTGCRMPKSHRRRHPVLEITAETRLQRAHTRLENRPRPCNAIIASRESRNQPAREFDAASRRAAEARNRFLGGARRGRSNVALVIHRRAAARTGGVRAAR